MRPSQGEGRGGGGSLLEICLCSLVLEVTSKLALSVLIPKMAYVPL